MVMLNVARVNNTTNYRKFSNNGALPLFRSFKFSSRAFQQSMTSPLGVNYMVVIYSWKALDLYFSDKGAPLLCLGALRPYWGIYCM